LSPPCSDTPFCARHRAFETDVFEQSGSSNSGLYYTIDPLTILSNDEEATITAQLNLATQDAGDLA
jgi:hypothetical protein